MNDLLRLRAAPHDRVAALIGYGVSPALVARLVRLPRIEAKLAALLTTRWGPLGPLDPGRSAILAMGDDDLLALASRAGVVWHAGAIARVIDGPSRQELVDRLGPGDYDLALAGLHLARSVEAPAGAVSPEAIAADGSACLAAWCDAQPPAIADRLRLIRPAASPAAVHHATGPAIVAWLLERRV